MSNVTRATKALEQAAVAFTTHVYAYDAGADRIGLQAAEALGVGPDCVLKTLMVRLDGAPVRALVPSDRELSMKRLAASLGGKRAEMMTPADAERLSGYKVGGISPFGQMLPSRAAVEEAVLALDAVFVNGGQRGLQVQLHPRDLVRALAAVTAPIAAD